MSLEADKISKAVDYARELLDKNGLHDWTIKVDRRRSTIAETFYKPKLMQFSRYFILQATKEQFEGVTLHEAAHAILGPGYYHGKEFVKKCIEISPNDEYARYRINMPLRKYIYTCPECKQSDSLGDKKERYCGICLKETKVVKFDITENIIKVKAW